LDSQLGEIKFYNEKEESGLLEITLGVERKKKKREILTLTTFLKSTIP